MPDLLIFGDSWAAGAEIDEQIRLQSCFGGQLANMLAAHSYMNFSETGSAVANLHVQLDYALQHHPSYNRRHTIAVFFITAMERQMIIDGQGHFWHLSPMGAVIRPFQHDHRESAEHKNSVYYKLLHSHDLDLFNLNVLILALQARCRFHGINDYYVAGWQALDLWREIDSSRIYEQGKTTCADILGLDPRGMNDLNLRDHPCITPNVSHPNIQGHRLIAEELYKFITKS